MKKKCCICKDVLTTEGHNPEGALDDNGNPIKWKKNDRCCDKCNFTKVVIGRLITFKKNKGKK